MTWLRRSRRRVPVTRFCQGLRGALRTCPIRHLLAQPRQRCDIATAHPRARARRDVVGDGLRTPRRDARHARIFHLPRRSSHDLRRRRAQRPRSGRRARLSRQPPTFVPEPGRGAQRARRVRGDSREGRGLARPGPACRSPKIQNAVLDGVLRTKCWRWQASYGKYFKYLDVIAAVRASTLAASFLSNSSISALSDA